ncbi:MAG TPA: sugar ABC transporter substrate-binding protein [Roseiflexaceae bacterium]|nr:sugar ABC transporter substrate-binding protein [Roseiflexaceae bacterium]
MTKGEKLLAAVGGTQVGENTKKLAESFQAKHPGVEIEFMPLQGRDHEEYFSKILAQIAAGRIPDMTTIATEGTQLFAGQGLGYPLDDYVKRDAEAMKEYFADVHPSLVEAMMYEGSLYTLPNDFNAANMYFNMNLLREAGLELPKEDWTKDDFYNMAKQLTKKEKQVYGYQWVNRLWGGWMPWIFVNGTNLLTEERAPGGEWLWSTFYKDDPSVKNRGGGWRWNAAKANDPANLEALEFMVQLQQEGLTPTAELGGGESVQGFFTGGQLAMTPAGGFWAGGLHNAGMKPDAFDVQYWPKWKSQRHQFGTAGWVMFEQAKNKDLVWEFMKFVNTKEAMQGFFEGNPTTPVRRSMMTAERYATTGPKNWHVFYDTLDKFPETAPIPAPPESNAMTQIFTKYTGLAVTAEQKPKDALDAMQKELEALLAKRKK